MATETMSGSKTLGCVKWFNNKQGFGFLTVTSGEHTGEDVFVHHSGIKVEEEQYRYLVQGEYVEFSLTEANSDEHKWFASDICGMNGGKLMCETRNLVRKERLKNTDGNSGGRGQGGSSARSVQTRPRGRGPREIHVQDEEGTEWNLVRVKSRRGQGKGGRRGGQKGGQHEDEY